MPAITVIQSDPHFVLTNICVIILLGRWIYRYKCYWWLFMQWLKSLHEESSITLITVSCHDANFVVTDSTGGWCRKYTKIGSTATLGFQVGNRCRRSSSTQEQRYPPPLPLGATAPPTCGRRKSDPGLGVTTQDQEYPLRKLPEIRDINLIAGYL